MKNLLLIFFLLPFSFCIFAQDLDISQSKYQEFTIGEHSVVSDNGQQVIVIRGYEVGKDKVYNGFKTVFKQMPAKKSWEFDANGVKYFMQYKDKTYSFNGFETTQKGAMVNYCTAFCTTLYRTGKPLQKHGI